MKRSWYGILAFSVALNLLGVGFMAGQFLGRHLPASNQEEPLRPSSEEAPPPVDGPPIDSPPIDSPMNFARGFLQTKALTPADRKTIRKALKQTMPEIRRQAVAIRKARRLTVELLLQTPIDRDAYDRAVDELAALEQAQIKLISDSLADGLAALPPERLAAIQEQMRQHMQERRRQHNRRARQHRKQERNNDE